MKQTIEKQKPSGIVDYFALAMTTVGVGYLPLAPGTWGSMVGVGIYVVLAKVVFTFTPINAVEVICANPWGMPSAIVFLGVVHAALMVSLVAFCLAGIWASGRAIPLLGNDDPSEAVVDEVMGQLITFCFVPFGIAWPFVLAGFLLFRLFDIWKPFPIRDLEILPGGLGICADDIVAGVYAGVCLAVGYAIYTAI